MLESLTQQAPPLRESRPSPQPIGARAGRGRLLRVQAGQRFQGWRAWARASVLAEYRSVWRLYLLIMSDLDSSSSSAYPKYLEHLSGDGKAIGVLTSGGDAQGARLPALSLVSKGRAGGEGGWRGLQRRVIGLGTEGELGRNVG